MPIRNFTNTAQPTSLTSPVGQDDTTLPVVSTTGYPSAPFTIAIDRGGANEEAVLVQGKTSNSFTDCVRGYNGTTKQSHLATVAVEHAAIALDYEDANDHIYDTTRDDHEQYYNEARLTAVLASGELPAPAFTVPIGAFVAYAGTVSPDTDLWLLCNGQVVSRTTYAALFGIIGTTFGAGDGLSTFGTPNLRGRVIVGLDNMGGASANIIVDAQADVLGGVFGAETVVLSTAMIPLHAHTIDHTHASAVTVANGTHDHLLHAGDQQFTDIAHSEAPSSGGTGGGAFGSRILVTGGSSSYGTALAAGSHSHTVTIPGFSGPSGNAGGGGAHPNTQPSMALAYLIRAA